MKKTGRFAPAAVMALAAVLSQQNARAQPAEVFRDPFMLKLDVGSGLVYEERFERAPYLVVRFRHLHPLAARPGANAGIKGPLATL